MRLGSMRQIQRGVGGFQIVAVVLNHRRIPLDRCPGGALVLGIVAVEYGCRRSASRS